MFQTSWKGSVVCCIRYLWISSAVRHSPHPFICLLSLLQLSRLCVARPGRPQDSKCIDSEWKFMSDIQSTADKIAMIQNIMDAA